MPALPAVPKVLKTIVNFAINNVPCVNIFHIQYAGTAPLAADCTSIASQVHGLYSQSFNTLTLPLVVLESVIVQDLTSQTAATGSHIANIPGTAAGVGLAASSSVVGSWSINNRYRGGKPRTYISGLPQTAMVDVGHWTTATVNSFTNAFSAFRTGVNTIATPALVAPFQLGCVHYRHGNAPLVNPYFDPFTGVTVQNGIRSQRGRLTT